MRKLTESTCNKGKMLLISCDEKCIVKVGTPVKPLALVPKSKTCCITTSVEVKAADHDEFAKSNIVPSTMLVIDIQNDLNLGKFCKEYIYVV